MNFLYGLVVILLLKYFFIGESYKKVTSKYFFILNTSITLIYIIWRSTTIPKHGLSLVLGTCLFICELFYAIRFIIFTYLSTNKITAHNPIKVIDNIENIPSVDILIDAANEEASILRRAIIGSKLIEYNKEKINIVVWDSKERNDIKELCKDYKVKYIPVNIENRGERLNYILGKTSSEIVMTLNGNMIPKNNILKETLMYFNNEELGYMQLIRNSYNEASYKYNSKNKKKIYSEMSKKEIEYITDARSGMLHIGINAIFRRSAIEKVGGVPKGVLDEELALGIKIQCEGYVGINILKTMLLNYGETDLGSFVSKIKRWAFGIIKLLKEVKFYKSKNLSFIQKVGYIYDVLVWFEIIVRVMYIVIVSICMLTSVSIISGKLDTLLFVFIPYLVARILNEKNIYPNNVRLEYNMYFSAITSPYIFEGLILGIFRSNYLEKKIGIKNKNSNIVKLIPYINILTFNIFVFIFSIINWLDGQLDYYYFLLVLPNIIYSRKLFIAIKSYKDKSGISIEKQRLKLKESIGVVLKQKLKNYDVKILELSESEIIVETEEKVKIDEYSSVSLSIMSETIYGIVEEKRDNILKVKLGNLNKNELDAILTLYISNLRAYSVSS